MVEFGLKNISSYVDVAIEDIISVSILIVVNLIGCRLLFDRVTCGGVITLSIP